ncbi:MAG: VTT domain-containing protein, partial [Dongiaceae bacterium]
YPAMLDLLDKVIVFVADHPHVAYGLVFLAALIEAVLGAVLGDGYSYWLGSRYQRAILTRWPLNRYARLVAGSEAFFARRGGKSVILGRFVPAFRAFVPLVAGILRMPAWRFYLANLLSALAWAPVREIADRCPTSPNQSKPVIPATPDLIRGCIQEHRPVFMAPAFARTTIEWLRQIWTRFIDRSDTVRRFPR